MSALLHLPVHGCRVISSPELTETHHTVRCPRHERAVPFSRCCGCAYLIAVDVDPDGQHGTIACAVAAGALPHGRVDVAEAAVRVRVGDVADVDTTCIRSDVPVEAVTEVLLEGQHGAMPVVDANRGLLGMLSKGDLLRELARAPSSARVVADVMTPRTQGLPEDAPIASAISLMAFERLNEVPILDASSRVIGMVTANDAMRWVAQALGYVTRVGTTPKVG